MEEPIEIRWHGRGGQGIITAAKLLAEAALEEGKYFQALPEYGAERMGAPIRAYTRISSQPIGLHCGITQPQVVVVLDTTLLSVVDVTEGLREGGALIINTPLSPGELRAKLVKDKRSIYTVDATRIAFDTLGRNIPNVPLLGALVKATGLVDKKSIIKEIRAKLGATLEPEIVEANVRAFERAYNETQEG